MWKKDESQQQKPKNRLLAAALWYADKGFRVFPLRPRGKEALIKDWPHNATNARNIITEWWTKYPDANIGILTGFYDGGFFCVLDFDPRHGGVSYDEWEKEGLLPRTHVVVTGGAPINGVKGRHYYYKTNEPFPTRKLREGIEIKGQGAYVVAPPSIHPETGEEYSFLVKDASLVKNLTEIPDWVIYEIYGEDVSKALWRMEPPIPLGTRHSYIVSLAGALWNTGLTTDEIEKITRAVIGFFETTAAFDVEGEIIRLIRDLPKWQKKPQKLELVIDKLPEATKNIVLQTLSETRPKEYKNMLQEKTTSQNSNNGQKSERKKRHSDVEIIEFLKKMRWVVWNGEHCYIRNGRIGDRDMVKNIVIAFAGRRVSKDALNDFVDKALYDMHLKRFEGLVLEDKLAYANVNGIEGLWGHYEGKIYCYLAHEERTLVFDIKDAPEGVYILDGSMGLPMIDEDVLRNNRECIRWFLEYIHRNGYKLKEDPKLVYSMFLPVVLSIDVAGFLLIGPGDTGKTTFASSFFYLEKGADWSLPIGNSYKDYIATLAGVHKTIYYDEMDSVSEDVQPMLKTAITGGKVKTRRLYHDKKTIEFETKNAVIISTTGIKNKVKSDFLDRFLPINFVDKSFTVSRQEMEKYMQEFHHKARAGVIALFRLAMKVKVNRDDVPKSRFPRWAEWAYRFAYVLGVSKKLVRYIKYAKLESMRDSEFGFLVDFFRNHDVEEGKPYKLRDIYMTATGIYSEEEAEEQIRHLYGVMTGGNVGKNEISLISRLAGYNVSIEKQIVDKQKGRKGYVLVFRKIEEVPPEVVYQTIKDNTEKDLQNVMSFMEGNGNGGDDGDGGGDDGGGGGGGDDGGGGGLPESPACPERVDEETGEFLDSNDADTGIQQVGDDETNDWDGTDENDFPSWADGDGDSDEPLFFHDIKNHVNELLVDFRDDPKGKLDETLQKLTEYAEVVKKRAEGEDLAKGLEYIKGKMNMARMIVALNGRVIKEPVEPYIPPSPREVHTRAHAQPAPAPPKPPAPPPAPPQPIHNRPAPPPPTPPPEIPSAPQKPRLNYETDDAFLGFMYAQMKIIRRNGGGDKEVLAYLLQLRDEVNDYLRQKGLHHAMYILDATIKSFYVGRRE